MSPKLLPFGSAVIDSSLIRSIFNPRFASTDLESRWQADRITSFKRVNTIALLFSDDDRSGLTTET